ncbi:MAG: GTP cyclohydrolase II [Pseudomonadota bacterium]
MADGKAAPNGAKGRPEISNYEAGLRHSVHPTTSTGSQHERAAGVPPFIRSAMKTPRKGDTSLFDEIAETTLPVEFRGEQVLFQAHAFEDDSSSFQAMALVHKTDAATKATLPLVRVHSGCVTGDVFHSLRCDCYAQLQLAIERIIATEFGIILYMPHHEGRGIGLVKKLQAYAAQDQGMDTVDANIAVGAPIDARDYRLPANILHYLGYPDIRLMTNNPIKVSKMTEHGVNVAEQVRSITPPSEHNERYLKTKRDRMDHTL